MTSYLSRLSPIPGFPEYTGPHKVGTIDVEIPISDLDSPAQTPSNAENIPTIQYRIFYPCDTDLKHKGKSVNWIPTPQRDYISAYSRFLGAGSTLAEVISYFPRLLHYVTIPVRKNAPLLKPTTSNNRWPVMIFSHGLGGSRNAYSHIVGSVASHGMIVIASEHRDGSTPISYIREPPSDSSSMEKEKVSQKHAKKTVDYVKLSHTPSPEVEEGRNEQLKIRLWEMGLIHDSLLKLDEGKKITNLNTSSTSLSMLKDQMNVHEPGKITFAGHSFGAATVVQFIKSVFYTPESSSAPKSYKPLYSTFPKSPICSQITPNNPIVLLDYFGILFPWITKKVFAAEEPERIMKLNVRAVMQLLRERGIEVSKTRKKDLELQGDEAETNDDVKIFGKDGGVRGWNWLSISDGAGGVAGVDEGEESEIADKKLDEKQVEVGKGGNDEEIQKPINAELAEVVLENEVRSSAATGAGSKV
ncbi:hypothetical protein EYC84_005036 [Monilinia fructicola]|uniref:Putative phospholipase n=1 Tax=Monilinia fructicola TaxID=38448 RepID=A0A5M9JW81_MONFR|nr:hypothetical protein EYC84_005036 [Monilinia fructicola]